MTPQFSFHLCTKHGVLVQRRNADFLALVQQARAAKARWSAELPHSRLRVKLLAPNGAQVPTSDIKAALSALADPIVFEAVSGRIAARFSGFEVARAGRVFCQAGVVAPPDSPDLGKTAISGAPLSGVQG